MLHNYIYGGNFIRSLIQKSYLSLKSRNMVNFCEHVILQAGSQSRNDSHLIYNDIIANTIAIAANTSVCTICYYVV